MGNTELIYKVSGSEPEPYVVTVNTEPFTLTCNCQAGVNGLPCRHRTRITQGDDLNITSGDTPELGFVKNAADAAGVPDILSKYDGAKEDKKEALKKTDKAFKAYREAREKLALGMVKTDKSVIKCRQAMEAAIDLGIGMEENAALALKALRVVFEQTRYAPKQAAGRARGWESKRLKRQGENLPK